MSILSMCDVTDTLNARLIPVQSLTQLVRVLYYLPGIYTKWFSVYGREQATLEKHLVGIGAEFYDWSPVHDPEEKLYNLLAESVPYDYGLQVQLKGLGDFVEVTIEVDSRDPAVPGRYPDDEQDVPEPVFEIPWFEVTL